MLLSQMMSSASQVMVFGPLPADVVGLVVRAPGNAGCTLSASVSSTRSAGSMPVVSMVLGNTGTQAIDWDIPVDGRGSRGQFLVVELSGWTVDVGFVGVRLR